MTAQDDMTHLAKFDKFGKSGTAEPKRYDIDLLRILEILRRRKWLLIGIVGTTVMSAIPGEGKSAFATSLARVVARSGLKVVLIDADLRRASATASLGLSCDGGLEAVVAKKQTLTEAMHTDHETGLDILPCKPSRNNPLDILSSADMSDLLSHIRREYHVVFIDTPPVAVVADALALAPLVDSTIFLIRWDSTPRDLALSCLHRLRRGGTEIASTLLTRVDLRKQVKYGTDRYGFYYRSASVSAFDKLGMLNHGEAGE